MNLHPRRRRTTEPRPRTRRTRSEDGTATAFVVGFAVVLLACAGLVIDGGNALNARMKLADDVEQSARAGAQEIDLVTLRDQNRVVLSTTGAEQAANSYLGAIGYTDYGAHVVRCADGTPDGCVQVQAQDTIPTTLLKLINVDTFSIKASATAQAVQQ